MLGGGHVQAMTQISSMPQAILPILPGLLDESYRVAITIWVAPWVGNTLKELVEIIAILNHW